MTRPRFVIPITITASMDSDRPRDIGLIEVDAHDYYRTLADGLRGMADQIEAMERDG